MPRRRRFRTSRTGSLGRSRFGALYKEVTPALMTSALFSLLPGFFLTYFTYVFLDFPGLILMVPALIGMRGNIFGSLSSKLSTSLHIGTLSTGDRASGQLRFLKNYVMLELLLLSFIIPMLAEALAAVADLRMSAFIDMVFITTTAAIVSGQIMISSTVKIVFDSYDWGLNPDNVAPTYVTTLGDIVALPIIILFALLAVYLMPMIKLVAVALTGIYTVFLLVYLLLRKCEETIDIMKERIGILLLCAGLSSLAGLALESYMSAVLAGSIFLFFVPMINGLGGNIGSTFASRLSTMFYIGESRIAPIPNIKSVKDGAALTAGAVTVFSVFAVGASLYNTESLSGILSVMLPLSIVIALVATVVAFYTTFIPVMLNLDPDNISIPLTSAIMDSVGSWTLILFILYLPSIMLPL